jgi:4-amino-4-deoxy-L-arabinose transferase-like glycosyltransferase
MQAAAQEEPTQESTQSHGAVVTLEVIVYVALILLSLVLRLAELDGVPLTDMEARQALASWRIVHPHAAGSLITPDSPLLLTLNNISFTILGGSEFAARLFTALAGVALGLSPLLFRSLFGKTRTLILCVLLTLSPVLLVASRLGSGAVWASLLAVLGLWALWRYWNDRKPRYAFFTAIFLAGTALLSEPGGIVLAIIVTGAGIIALLLTSQDDPDRLNLPENDLTTAVRQRFAALPWQMALAAAAAGVVLVSTGFLLYPTGLSSVSQSLGSALSGISNARPSSLMFYPLFTSLFYEPYLWGFALAGLWLLRRRGAFTFVERFFGVWAVLGLLASIFYAGAGPEHALWLTLPLVGLESYTGAALLVDDENTWGISLVNDQYVRWQIPHWSKWIVAGAMFGLLIILSAHTQIIARNIMTIPVESSLNDVVNLIFSQQYLPLLRSLIWALLAIVFISVGYFMVASLWGNQTAAQGMALGALVFGILTSAGSGWNATFPSADDPAEPWHLQASASEIFLLRSTLTDLAQRNTGGFDELTLAVMAPDDGAVAWAVRDYDSTHFIHDVNEARGQEIVLLPATAQAGDEKPDLGGSYVGEKFIVSRSWSPQTMRAVDLLAWWTQRKVRIPAFPWQTIVLWARQDVYDGAAGQG